MCPFSDTTSAKSRIYTAFVTPFGLCEFNMLPMGINIGHKFDRILGDVKFNYIFAYCDYIIVCSSSIREHIDHLLEAVFRLQLVMLL